jgi:DNA-binding SARP family transcriptional activator
LAYLAWQNGRPVSPDRLCTDLWPDHPQGGRQALQSTVARLRRALRWGGETLDPVPFERGLYRLNPALAVEFDAAELQQQHRRAREGGGEIKLEALRAAQALYQGAFLEGYNDDWACLRRQDLEQQHHQAMGDLGDLLRERKEYSEALVLFGRLLDLEPCWEQGHQGVVKALYESGRRDEAVRHYHRYVETLKNQLGLSPSPDMLRLYHSLLT